MSTEHAAQRSLDNPRGLDRVSMRRPRLADLTGADCSYLGASDAAYAAPASIQRASSASCIYVLVRDGARQQPDLSAAMRGAIRMRFGDDYPPMPIDLCGDEIEVCDIAALVIAPLVGGLPKPTNRHGRRAIARLADGRVDLRWVPCPRARDLLRLLGVDADRAASARPADRASRR